MGNSDLKFCIAEGCDNFPTYTNGCCKKHYDQIRYHGFLRERSISDANDVVIENGICRIFLYNQKSEKISETLIDAEDWERCKNHKWSVGGRGYVRNGNHPSQYLANFILNVKTNHSIVIDHKDGDILNNRKNNLQVISQQKNIWKQKDKNNHRCVFWNKEIKRWVAQVVFNKKKYYLGCFVDIKDAKEKRDSFRKGISI